MVEMVTDPRRRLDPAASDQFPISVGDEHDAICVDVDAERRKCQPDRLDPSAVAGKDKNLSRRSIGDVDESVVVDGDSRWLKKLVVLQSRGRHEGEVVARKAGLEMSMKKS